MMPGTLVRLRILPYCAPGKVVGMTRGKILVHWADLGFTGKHPAESLVAVNEPTQTGGGPLCSIH